MPPQTGLCKRCRIKVLFICQAASAMQIRANYSGYVYIVNARGLFDYLWNEVTVLFVRRRLCLLSGFFFQRSCSCDFTSAELLSYGCNSFLCSILKTNATYGAVFLEWSEEEVKKTSLSSLQLPSAAVFSHTVNKIKLIGASYPRAIAFEACQAVIFPLTPWPVSQQVFPEPSSSSCCCASLENDKTSW